MQVSDTIRSRAWGADQQDADIVHVLNKVATTLNALKTDTQGRTGSAVPVITEHGIRKGCQHRTAAKTTSLLQQRSKGPQNPKKRIKVTRKEAKANILTDSESEQSRVSGSNKEPGPPNDRDKQSDQTSCS